MDLAETAAEAMEVKHKQWRRPELQTPEVVEVEAHHTTRLSVVSMGAQGAQV